MSEWVTLVSQESPNGCLSGLNLERFELESWIGFCGFTPQNIPSKETQKQRRKETTEFQNCQLSGVPTPASARFVCPYMYIHLSSQNHHRRKGICQISLVLHLKCATHLDLAHDSYRHLEWPNTSVVQQHVNPSTTRAGKAELAGSCCILMLLLLLLLALLTSCPCATPASAMSGGMRWGRGTKPVSKQAWVMGTSLSVPAIPRPPSSSWKPQSILSGKHWTLRYDPPPVPTNQAWTDPCFEWLVFDPTH
jgi:hypothetical protein